MASRNYVDEWKVQADQRRVAAELRTVYGNALSNINLGRNAAKFEAGPISSVYPFGRSQPNCCHISGVLDTRKPQSCAKRQPHGLVDVAPNDVDRCYEYLQRRALRQARRVRIRVPERDYIGD